MFNHPENNRVTDIFKKYADIPMATILKVHSMEFFDFEYILKSLNIKHVIEDESINSDHPSMQYLLYLSSNNKEFNDLYQYSSSLLTKSGRYRGVMINLYDSSIFTKLDEYIKEDLKYFINYICLNIVYKDKVHVCFKPFLIIWNAISLSEIKQELFKKLIWPGAGKHFNEFLIK